MMCILIHFLSADEKKNDADEVCFDVTRYWIEAIRV